VNLQSWWVAVGLVVLGCLPRPAADASAGDHPPAPATSADPEPWRANVPAPGAAGTLVYPVPKSFRLSNSLQVLVVRQPIQVVALLAIVRHGAGSVPQGKSGLAGLTARLLTEGTLRRSSEEVAIATEDLGSELEADAGQDYSSLTMTVLPENLDEAMQLLAEVLLEPAFRPREFDRVRDEWLDRIVAERQSPERLSTLAGLRLLLGPIRGAPVGGSVPDVKQLTTDDVRGFYARYYLPNESAIVVVGDVTGEQVHAIVAAQFEHWKASGTVPPLPPPPEPAPPQRRIVIVDRPGAAQSALCVVQGLPPRSAPGHEAREVMNALLGGMFTSRLNQNLREQHGYTYGAGSAALATREWGAYLVTTTVEARATGAAIDEIVRELRTVADAAPARPITDDELDRAKSALINARAAHLESASVIAQDTAQLFVHGLPLDYYATYSDRIGRVTRAAVGTEARQHLAPEHLNIVVVGPQSDVEPGLHSPRQTVETAHPSLLE
jgi:zinc protease